MILTYIQSGELLRDREHFIPEERESWTTMRPEGFVLLVSLGSLLWALSSSLGLIKGNVPITDYIWRTLSL